MKLRSNAASRLPKTVPLPLVRTAVVALALLASVVSSWAQVTAAISGRIEDPTGAGIGGAAITVKSAETGLTRTATTDEAGNYHVDSLPLGAIEVHASKTGFKEAIRTGVDLALGQDASVNLRLAVGDAADHIDIVEGIPTVNISTSPISGLVTEEEVKDLPLNGRSLDQLLTTNPGALNYSALKSSQTTTSDGNTFSVAGRRPGDNQFLLNGVEYSGSSQLAVTPGGVSGELLGIDGIREFNVLTDTYGAQYGKRAGAQVSIVTQSGGNVLHGSLFEFLRNSDLDARNFFDQSFVPPFRRNQFGGALGGPIRRNKLFLFGNYEGFQQSLALTSVSVVPDNQTRQGLLPNATTGIYAKVANLNTGMLPYMTLWPTVNGPELTTQAGLPTGTAYSYNNPKQFVHENFGTSRADYTISDRDSASLFYTIDTGNSVLPQADPLFTAFEALTSQVASAQETHIFSPSLLNTATFGFTRAAFNFDPGTATQFPASLSFVTGLPPGGITVSGAVTTTGSGVITAAGANNASGSWNRRDLFTLADDVQKTHGIHHFSAGAWLQRLRDNEDTGSRQLGIATFASLTTLLQGTVTTFQVIPNANELGWRSTYGAWYAQDAIHLRRLTLQAGIRQEMTSGWNEESGRAANYITNGSGVLLTNPVIGSSILTKNNMKKLFAPRVSAAWDVFGNGKTAVRAGYGIYYSMIDALNFLMNSLPPANSSLSFANQALLPLLPISQTAPPACGPGSVPACSLAPQGLEPDAKALAVNEWNFTIEQQIARNTSLRVAYVGSFSTHGLLSVDPNTIAPQICQSATCVSGGTPGTTKGSVVQGQQYIPVTTRPNPNLGAGFFWYTEGNSRYNALQTDIVRRISHGLEIRGNYTWSKNLDMNSGLTGAQSNNQSQMVMDPYDLGRDWGPSALNVAQQAGISLRYQLPVGHGQALLSGLTGIGEDLLGGWQVNSIVTLLSGFPITPVDGSNRSGDGDTRNPDRPSLNTSFSGPVIEGTPTQWFNPNAFILPIAGTYGTLGRGVYSGPGLAETDLSLFKSISLKERMHLQFRAEGFNLFNRANFGTPNATVFSGTAISPTAGLITTTATSSRQIQFGLKLIF